jgi:hypothetical protein
MEDVSESGGSNSRAGLIEDWLWRALAQTLSAPEQRGRLGEHTLELGLEGFERGDTRAAQTVPDDGGERLSTAPSTVELNGQVHLAWGAQATEWLHRAEQRQWSSALAQKAMTEPEVLAATPHPAGTAEPSATDPSGVSAAQAAPLTAGDVRDMQSTSVLDWDRFGSLWMGDQRQLKR